MKAKNVSPYYSNPRHEMISFIHGNPQHILEIGCGAGCFRNNFPSNIEYWGVEPCAVPASLANVSMTKTLVGTYDSVRNEIPDRHFDLVVCNDVIEHMADPRGFLRDIGSKLVKGGSMIVSIPNLRNAITLYELLIRGDFRYADAGTLDYTHLHLFTMKSFLEMANECGWKVEVCRPINELPFKFVKGLILSCLKWFIPEIKSFQIAVRMVLKP